MNTFADLKLSPALARAIQELGYVTPTPIQAKTLEILLEGPTDLLGLAATGTGKTAAFGIPLIERIEPERRSVQAVVLCPTRELASQVTEQLNSLGKYKGVSAVAIYGGAAYGPQIRAMREGASVVVATPGRLVDHLKRGTLSLTDLRTVVLDEADEMLSMGFQDDLEFILQQVPREQSLTWLFTATMSPGLRRVTDNFLRNTKIAEVNRTEMLSGTVKQVYYTVREKNKPKGLCKLLDVADDFYGLIFCQTKALVSDLTEFLRARGYKVDALHGDKTQGERERTLKQFRDRTTTVLVCSDVAARGLDVQDLTHVINYSLPKDFDSYVHRIGRTARSGRAGLAISLVAPAQAHLIERIEKRTKTKFEQAVFPARRGISAKKVAQILPNFTNVVAHDKALELLDDTWLTAIAGMEKNEIVARFLALAFPQLFVDDKEPEETMLGHRERPDFGDRPRRERPERPDFTERRRPRPETRRPERAAPGSSAMKPSPSAPAAAAPGQVSAAADTAPPPAMTGWQDGGVAAFESEHGAPDAQVPRPPREPRPHRDTPLRRGGPGDHRAARPAYSPHRSDGPRRPRFGGPRPAHARPHAKAGSASHHAAGRPASAAEYASHRPAPRPHGSAPHPTRGGFARDGFPRERSFRDGAKPFRKGGPKGRFQPPSGAGPKFKGAHPPPHTRKPKPEPKPSA